MTNKKNIEISPSIKIDPKEIFGVSCEFEVYKFKEKTEHVPEIDQTYIFDPATTLSILAGFSSNRRVLIQGYHGTGKSTHIEQVAARLNWPCIRINLDSHISRIDLIGKDAIVLKDNKQVTEFQDGILPWSYKNPVALVFDEYDAGRPDVMFVIQRVLESEGSFTLLDKNKVLQQHDLFRIFATTNTVGLGDTTGLYHGTQQINQGQMDRWNIVSTLNYLPFEKELEIVLAKNKNLNNESKNTSNFTNISNNDNLITNSLNSEDPNKIFYSLIDNSESLEETSNVNNSLRKSEINQINMNSKKDNFSKKLTTEEELYDEFNYLLDE